MHQQLGLLLTIWNQLKLAKLDTYRWISIGVHSKFEVLQWNEWYNEFIDLPKLKEIELGTNAFGESLSTIMESMFW